ncbi:MAG: T9SS type A sorting domain-containing protein [Bacteroidia bacterium]
MKKLIYILITGLLCSSGLKAQLNLVPNPGFDDTLQCDHGFNEFQGYVAKWYGLNVQYFNGYCAGPGTIGQPYNEWGFQWSRSGPAYAGLATIYLDSFAYTKNVRDYIYVPLTDTLRAGKWYFVSFYVNLSNNAMYACSDFGAKFTTQQPVLDHTLMNSPQVHNNPVLNPLTDTANWMMVKGRFIASGGEKFMILGNFVSDSLSHIKYMHATPNLSVDWRESFYYIDDIFVGQDSTLVMDAPNQAPVHAKINVYPNPNRGQMQFSYELGTREQSVLEIYDISGRLITSLALDPDRTLLSIQEGLMQPGMYFYQVRTHDALLASGKFTVLR